MMPAVAALGRGIIIITGPPCQSRSGSEGGREGRGGWRGELSPIWCPKSAQDSRQTDRVCCTVSTVMTRRHNGAACKPPPPSISVRMHSSEGLIHLTHFHGESNSSGRSAIGSEKKRIWAPFFIMSWMPYLFCHPRPFLSLHLQPRGPSSSVLCEETWIQL